MTHVTWAGSCQRRYIISAFHILFRESFTLIGSVLILVLLQTFTAIRSEAPCSLRSRCIIFWNRLRVTQLCRQSTRLVTSMVRPCRSSIGTTRSLHWDPSHKTISVSVGKRCHGPGEPPAPSESRSQAAGLQCRGVGPGTRRFSPSQAHAGPGQTAWGSVVQQCFKLNSKILKIW